MLKKIAATGLLVASIGGPAVQHTQAETWNELTRKAGGFAMGKSGAQVGSFICYQSGFDEGTLSPLVGMYETFAWEHHREACMYMLELLEGLDGA
ncbi:hypothetical protein [Ferrimonas marina]|nr:hypothetical protein [Ferrimonas marina]